MTNFVNWPRARPTSDFRISLTIGTSSVAASGMRNNDVTIFFLRASLRSAKNKYSSFQSPYGLLPILVQEVTPHYYSDDWSERSERNEECFLNELDYLILYYPACARRCAGACTHVRSHFERENLSRVAI